MTARAENTKQKILQAAEPEFAEKGIYGARVDEIAVRAGVNKRMLYAYFGSKEQLYVAVIEEIYRRLAEWEAPLLTQCAGSAEEVVRLLIRSYFDFLGRNTSFVKIVMRENLNEAQYLRLSAAKDIKGKTLALLQKSLQTGIENGTFRADIDLAETVLSINLLCFSYFSNGYTFTQLLQTDFMSKDEICRRADHVTDMILKYLK
ncbi:MAG: TetR/AcrR family transcriptional regulator [Ruminococcaceae bacterium]|nr:TetR/AcrR family transcriptional regulator [Oscillospiraceae bacterium]